MCHKTTLSSDTSIDFSNQFYFKTRWFTLIVLSALRRSDNENMLSRSSRIRRILKDGGEDFRYSDTERLSRSDEVLKLKNFKKDATLKLSKSTNQECFGMSSNEFDKETGSSDGLQQKQPDLNCVHALNKLHLLEILVVQVNMKLINISCVQIPNQLDISHKFAPLRRKSIQKLGVHLKLFQFHIIDVHVIE
ncbi:hypothetical protein Tco_0399634 [Tanacetum coccineum]